MQTKYNRHDENVLRPSIKRWLPGWVARIRHAGTLLQSDNSPNPTCQQSYDNSNVHMFPVSAASATSSENHDKRICELELQNAVLIGDCAEWTERCQSLEINLHRAREQVELAEQRISSMGESIPESTTEPLSPLQESFRNFEMAVTLLESKLEQSGQRVVALQEKRSCVAAEILILSPAPFSTLPEQTTLPDESMPDVEAMTDDKAMAESLMDTVPDIRDAA